MNIILISGVPMLPAYEGNRSRILALTRAIRSQGHQLWVAVLPSNISEPGDRLTHENEFGKDRYIEICKENSSINFIKKLPERIYRKICRSLNLPNRYYLSLDYLYSKSWNHQLCKLNQEINFDAAIVEYVFHSEALLAFPKNVKKIIDTHDAFADRHIQYIKRGLTDYFYSTSPREESRGFRRADTIIAIQEMEAKVFKEQLKNHKKNPSIAIVSHFNDLSIEPVVDHTPCSVLFLGSANSSNTLAIQTFITNVLPAVLSKLPNFKLTLAGKICNNVDNHSAILKLGNIENVIDAFIQAPVLINPMQVGTGINIKLLDAMTAGVPVISTSNGMRGLPIAYRDFLIEVPDNDNLKFSEQIIFLLQDIKLRKELGEKARSSAIRWNSQQNKELSRILSPN